jgi:membrane protease YdiL (CAAX protease family)
MLQKAISVWNSLYFMFLKVPFVFYLIIIAIYFWVNGSAHFSDWANTYSPLILPYMVMMLAFIIYASPTAEKRIKISTQLALPAFVVFFIMTWIIMEILIQTNLLGVTPAPVSTIIPLMVLHICVVAPAEELMFRGVILDFFKSFAIIGILIQASLFSIWHYYAYSGGMRISSIGALSPFIFAFIIGIILGFIALRKEWGLPAAIGVHAAYNLSVLGVLTFL